MHRGTNKIRNSQTNKERVILRSNFVAIVGNANAGKSTLLNAIMHEKISIVSPKAQTTRTNIKGIKVINDTQLVFIDTPGFCRSGAILTKLINKNLKGAYRDADTVLVVIDATDRNHSNISKFISNLDKTEKTQIVIAINKVDLVDKCALLETADKLNNFACISAVFMISAKNNDGIDDLQNYLYNIAVNSVWFYQDAQITDSSLSFRLSEITREKIFVLLKQELPYNIYVDTECYKETNSKILIHQSIITTKCNHKMIIIGKNAQMIKEIKRLSIADMKKLLNNKSVTLKLFVRIEKNWINSKEHLSNAHLI